MTFEKTSYSQFGEDLLLEKIFETENGPTCVEVGANDGVTGSMSLLFERSGWSCVLVEPNPELCSRLRVERNSFLFEGAASSSVGKATLMIAEGGELSHAVSSIVPGSEGAIKRNGHIARPVEVNTEPLDSILERANVEAGCIAFVSIDVEGHELEVLKGFSLARWRPKILLIEDNSLFFASDVNRYLQERGYIRFRRTGVNDWYASKEFLPLVSRHPAGEYRRSMIRARLMMARRLAFARLQTVPILRAVLVKPLLALKALTNA